MSAHKHTAGPWTLGVMAEGEASWFEVRGSADSDGWMTVVADMIDEQADAYLISTAPELLAALEGLLADIQDYQRINNLGGENNYWQVIARAAIAKATGAA